MFQVVQLRAPAPPKVLKPEPYKLRTTDQIICTFDTETDPFKYGRVVKPFTCGFYDGVNYVDFWGDDCINQFIDYLRKRRIERPSEKLLVYCHNFGNFDAYFLIDYFDAGMSPFIMNGRLVQVFIEGVEFRDSYSAIPVPLADYQKTEVDYTLFEREVREANQHIIRPYQKDDCVFLHELISEWVSLFGTKLTMASVALPTLKSFHGFESMKPKTDEEMRPFYFGGRCQAFQTGMLKGDWKIYDVNSMYPFVMSSVNHPVSSEPRYEKRITTRSHFAKIDAWSDGALPVRKDNGGLDFPTGKGTFFACIHEINAGIDTGTLRILKTHYSIYFDIEANFKEFIETYYARRMEAKANGDKIRTLFYKLVMNSSYGKFAQDPRNYERYLFNPDEIPSPLRTEDDPKGWYIHTMRSAFTIYAKASPSEFGGFYNVATAASITSAARALLLRGISKAKRPIYCDTDSLICEGLDMDLDDKRLGAWGLEATGDMCAIAGKKLYAVFNEEQEVKKASKGVRLTAVEIARVAKGETVEYANPVPKFSLKRNLKDSPDASFSADFISRKISRTGLHL